MRGAAFFLADLAREISIPLRFEFLQISSYHDSIVPSKEIQPISAGSKYIKHRHILIVEDIIDTGQTLKLLTEHLKKLNPKSLKICTLLDKPHCREVALKIDYLGFEIPNVFVVGYGLDYAQLHRNLPYIAVLENTPQ